MTNSCELWSIVLVPRPLTPFAAFAWYAISELLPVGGLVREKRFFRWVDATHPRGELHSPHGVILNLNAERKVLEAEILRWLKSPLAGVPNKRSVSVRDFVSQGTRWQNWSAWEVWFSALSKIQSPEVALGFSSALFRKLIDEQIDPRVTLSTFPQLPMIPPPIILPEISDQRVITIPVVKKRGVMDSVSTHREATDFSIKHLPKKNMFRLCREHILLAVAGPSGSGKSTLVASLYIEIANILTEFETCGGAWKNLKLVVDVALLDAATPVTDSVILSKAQDRDIMASKKREWTMNLAAEAVDDAARKLESANLVLADLPGKITDITEALSAHISYGGIVTSDWGEIRKWRDYFDSIGVPILFEIKSSEEPSLVTTYLPGEKLMGRINKLDRVARGWDSFVRTLAEFLVFDILPSMVDRSAKQITSFDKVEEDGQITQ